MRNKRKNVCLQKDDIFYVFGLNIIRETMTNKIKSFNYSLTCNSSYYLEFIFSAKEMDQMDWG